MKTPILSVLMLSLLSVTALPNAAKWTLMVEANHAGGPVLLGPPEAEAACATLRRRGTIL